jgi:hypothetical protein
MYWADDQIGLQHEICQILYRYAFYSEPGMTSGFYEGAVELGFACFANQDTSSALAEVDGSHAQADETLALLAGVSWMTQKEITMGQFADDQLRSSEGKGFELVVAHYLSIAFGKPTKLSEVLDFRKDLEPAWAHQEGCLVAANARKDGQFDFAEVNFGRDKRVASACLGYKAEDPKATIRWLKNPRYTAFCFPDIYMGPDICFFLRLEDGNIISVFLQVKCVKDCSRDQSSGCATQVGSR